jgi:uncharacterized protein YuzE
MAYSLLSVDSMNSNHDNRCKTGGSDENRKASANLATIRGIVIPIDWDEKGNVVAIALSAFNEEEYLVDKDEKGELLKAFVRKEVEVRGILREEKNRQIIAVKETMC